MRYFYEAGQQQLTAVTDNAKTAKTHLWLVVSGQTLALCWEDSSEDFKEIVAVNGLAANKLPC